MQTRYNVRILALNSLAELEAEIGAIVPDATAAAHAVARLDHRVVRIDGLGAAEAQLLREHLLARGGTVLISPIGPAAESASAALISGSLYQLHDLVRHLKGAALPAAHALAAEIAAVLEASTASARGGLEIAGHSFVWGARTYVMGIINVTPDSFSADGLAQPGADVAAAARALALRFAEEGADVLDVGGESTRPGARPPDLDEELRRVVPAIAAIAGAVSLPISVDTYHAEVAAAALDAGAHMINDVWGLRTPTGEWNEPLAALASRRGVPIVLMHNRRAQAINGHYPQVVYRDLLAEVIAGLREQVAYAESRGIRRDRIIIDPGLGFGKTPAQNLTLLRRLSEFRALGLPLLIGASRKSFIGLALNLPPPERDEGTAAVTALAVQAGADIVRVHNVRMNVRAARVADAIVRQHPQ